MLLKKNIVSTSWSSKLMCVLYADKTRCREIGYTREIGESVGCLSGILVCYYQGNGPSIGQFQDKPPVESMPCVWLTIWRLFLGLKNGKYWPKNCVGFKILRCLYTIFSTKNWYFKGKPENAFLFAIDDIFCDIAAIGYISKISNYAIALRIIQK